MKFEFEILEKDLEDRRILEEMRTHLNNLLASLSQYGKNTMIKGIDRIINNIEFAQAEWLLEQKQRVFNLLTTKLNIPKEQWGIDDDY